MMDRPDLVQAREALLDAAVPVGTEIVPLERCGGRVLARNLTAAVPVPPFDRSPYDGYAFRAEDTLGASPEQPVTLRVLETVPAGAVPSSAVTAGTAVKVMTGAPIPGGADAVCKYEMTRYTEAEVTLFQPFRGGENIVRAGEDTAVGAILARRGEVIDGGLAGTLAGQGVAAPEVFCVPRVGILSTGEEVAEVEEPLEAGKIRNSNRYALGAALTALGCCPVYLGCAGDSVPELSRLLREGLERCDAVISTGGVSAGDWDLTPAAMEEVGGNFLFRCVRVKPGMACACAVKSGKLLCGLSGNPAAALCSLYAVVAPALRKLAGRRDPRLREVFVSLAEPYRKERPYDRLLWGRLCFRADGVWLACPQGQGNGVLSGSIGCDVLAVVPAGSGPLPAGAVLRGILIGGGAG